MYLMHSYDTLIDLQNDAKNSLNQAQLEMLRYFAVASSVQPIRTKQMTIIE